MRRFLPYLVGAASAAAFFVACGIDTTPAEEPDAGTTTLPSDAGGATVCDCPAPPKAVVHTLDCVGTEPDERGQQYFSAQFPIGELTDADLGRVTAVECDLACVPGPCRPDESRCRAVGWMIVGDALRFGCGDISRDEGLTLRGAHYAKVYVRVAP